MVACVKGSEVRAGELVKIFSVYAEVKWGIPDVTPTSEYTIDLDLRQVAPIGLIFGPAGPMFSSRKRLLRPRAPLTP